MKLIEQLGGYEEAKKYLDKLQKMHIHDQTEDTISYLPEALLQYRRENNIFEVGDSIILINGYSDEVYYLSGWYIKGLDFRYTTKSGAWGVIVRSSMVGIWRHATAQEIEVGRRL